jgi:CspA family cold shock protein
MRQPLTGEVRTWLEFKGYGFISPDDGGRDVFVHSSALDRAVQLTAGARVEYELEECSPGRSPRAHRCRLVGRGA